MEIYDPLLKLAAEVLDDLERVRISNENRLRQLTRGFDEVDADGKNRGFGLTTDHPDVRRLTELVDALVKAEGDAEFNLKKLMQRHPLGPWMEGAKGVGWKQGPRLLAAIGDPFWNDLYDRPRLVSELWSFSGYGDAAKQVRTKGVKSNWSPDAKMRAFLISESASKRLVKPCYSEKGEKGEYLRGVHVEDCTCSPYRLVYDQTRAKYADAKHDAECKRCGPKGKPAQPGTPLGANHIKARAFRAMSKALLRDLWLEAKRLHEAS